MVTISANAQNLNHNQVFETQQNIESSIKGTLDGVVNLPKNIHKGARQLVFPNSNNVGFSVNPWSNNRPQQMRRPNVTGGFPKGNPWAPIGAPNFQGAPQNQLGVENNPYTDANSGQFQAPISGNAFGNNSFNAFSNQNSPFSQGYNHQLNNGFYDGSNGSFSTPFGDSFFPSTNFWPGGNNGNNSFPFMPW